MTREPDSASAAAEGMTALQKPLPPLRAFFREVQSLIRDQRNTTMSPSLLSRLLTALRRRDRRHPPRRVWRPRLECLEGRIVPTVNWIGGSGDWSDGSHWSSGVVPGANDDVVISSPTPITVSHAAGADSIHSLIESAGATLDLTGGSLSFTTTFQINGSLLIDGGTLDLHQRDLAGSGVTTVTPGASWTILGGDPHHTVIGTALDNQGTLEVRGGVNFAGTFANDAGATLRVISDGSGAISSDVLRVANSFTNHGEIDLSTTQPTYFNQLGVVSGTLTNAADGIIHTLTGAGGRTNLNGRLDNQGTITVDSPLNLDLAGTVTDLNSGTITLAGADLVIGSVNTGTNSTFINTGTITIGSGRTLDAGGNASNFNNTGGSMTGTGTLSLGGNATFDHDFTTAGLNLLLFFGTYHSPGTLTVSHGSTLTVHYVGAVDAAMVNDGLIDLTSIVGPNNCQLTVTRGLTNATDGTILSDVGTGLISPRMLTAQLDNEGDIEVNASLTIAQGSGIQLNNGTVNVHAGTLTVNLSGSSAGYTNNGSLAVGTGTTLVISGGPLTNFSNGTLSGGTYNVAGTFKFNDAAIATNDATLILDGSGARIVDQSNTNALTGLAANTANGTLDFKHGISFSVGSFQNAGSFKVEDTSVVSVGGSYTQTSGTTTLAGGTLNAGTLIDIEGGVVSGTGTLGSSVLNNGGRIIAGFVGNPGVLTITGDFTQTSGGDLYIEIGGPNAGTDFGQLAVGGTANLDGTLTVMLINGFVPGSGTSYQVLVASAVNGSFATLDGDGPLFTPAYNPGDVTLVAN
jgi:hypothetical protein